MSEVSFQVIIHCTKKLSAKLPERHAEPADGKNPLGDWHANLHVIDRRQCVLFCHDKTRFALFLAGLKKPDFENLDYLFRDLFINTLLKSGYALETVEYAAGLMQHVEVVFDANCNRSVLGTMKSVVHQDLFGTLMRVDNVMDLLPYSTSARLNDRPTRVKGMRECLWPNDEMRSLLESLQQG